MGWMEQVGELLQRYSGNNANIHQQRSDSEVNDHFEQIAQVAPPSAVSQGIGEAFRSDKTPPFEQMLSQLFNQSSLDQKTGLLNKLLQVIGPSLLGQLGLNPNAASISNSDASRVDPQDVQKVASAAHTASPGIIDQMSDFYSQHPTLIKQLGGAALTIALAKMAKSSHVM